MVIKLVAVIASFTPLLGRAEDDMPICKVQAEGQAFCNFSEGLLLAFDVADRHFCFQPAATTFIEIAPGPLDFAPTYQHIPGLLSCLLVGFTGTLVGVS